MRIPFDEKSSLSNSSSPLPDSAPVRKMANKEYFYPFIFPKNWEIALFIVAFLRRG